MTKMFKKTLGNKSVFLGIILLPVFLLSQQIQSNSKDTLRIAYDEYLFSKVDKNDAVTAVDMWIKEFVIQINRNKDIQTEIKQSFIKDIYSVMKDGPGSNYDLIILLSTDYLQYNSDNYWQPVVVSADEGQHPEEFFILAHKDTQVKELKNLAAKTIAIQNGPESRFSLMWLNNLTRLKFNTAANDFFMKIEKRQKKSKAVLDVFFKKTNACVVGFNTFKTMNELNPQLAKKLRVIETSPPFVKGLLCLRRDYNSDLKPAIIESLLKLEKTTVGKQVLTLYGEARLLPFNPQDLQQVKILVDTHKRLQKMKNDK